MILRHVPADSTLPPVATCSLPPSHLLPHHPSSSSTGARLNKRRWDPLFCSATAAYNSSLFMCTHSFSWLLLFVLHGIMSGCAQTEKHWPCKKEIICVKYCIMKCSEKVDGSAGMFLIDPLVSHCLKGDSRCFSSIPHHRYKTITAGSHDTESSFWIERVEKNSLTDVSVLKFPISSPFRLLLSPPSLHRSPLGGLRARLHSSSSVPNFLKFQFLAPVQENDFPETKSRYTHMYNNNHANSNKLWSMFHSFLQLNLFHLF